LEGSSLHDFPECTQKQEHKADNMHIQSPHADKRIPKQVQFTLPSLDLWEGRDWISHYEPLQKRRKRDAHLQSLAGEKEGPLLLRYIGSEKATKGLYKGLKRLKSPLIRPPHRLTGRSMRLVVISDTHNSHKKVVLPKGDVLVHTGDLCGNYGKQDIASHFQSVLAWFKAQAQVFRYVVFIAGNHDTFLDPGQYPDEYTQAPAAMRASLPPNVFYLENSGVSIEGLRFYGCPAVTSRLETMGARYYSNGWERPEKERTRLFASIPEETHVLLTHGSPLHCGREGGDHLLTSRLGSMATPPLVHCFGHNHMSYGVYTTRQGSNSAGILHLNTAQEHLHRIDKNHGGSPLVVDLLCDSE
jgi:hypothetical protein